VRLIAAGSEVAVQDGAAAGLALSPARSGGHSWTGFLIAIAYLPVL